eukprot:c8071_g1_i1.p1 GENE.c8071_g1_i1~~c8071_g1_i1.p1  ORF type:complete len:266 (+),score=55.99 c8071_g1_i1:238-1035(+)
MRRARTSYDLQSLDSTGELSSQSLNKLDPNNESCSQNTLSLKYNNFFETDDETSSPPPMKRRARTSSIPTLTPSHSIDNQSMDFLPQAHESESAPTSPVNCSTFVCPHTPTCLPTFVPTTPTLLGPHHTPKTRKLSRHSPMLAKSAIQRKSSSFTCSRHSQNDDSSPKPQGEQDIVDAISSFSLSLQQEDSSPFPSRAPSTSELVLIARSPNSGVPVADCSASLVHQEMLFVLFGVFGVLCVAVGWLENTMRKVENQEAKHKESC